MKYSTGKDYFWNTIGAFLQSAISPALLILITRMNGIDDSGVFSFGLAVAVVLWALGMWGGRTYQVSDVKGDFTNAAYIAARFITSTAMIILATIFCLINGYGFEKSGIILLLVVFKAVESVADAMYGVLQSNNKLHLVGVSLAVKAVLGFFIFWLCDVLTGSIGISVLALILVNLLVVFVFDLPQMKKLEDIPLSNIMKFRYVVQAIAIMKQSWPVFIVIFLMMFALNTPRYFLDIHHESQIGYFGIMAMPITLLALMVTFIIQPSILHMSNLYAKQRLKAFSEIVSKLTWITLVLGVITFVITYFIGIWMLNLMFSIQLETYRIELLIMVAGAIANAVAALYVNTLTVMRKFKGQFYVLLATNIVLVLVASTVIKHYAMMGSVLLFLAISAVQALLLWFVYRNSVRTMAIGR